MPTPTGARNSEQTLIGPGWLYFDVPIPATGVALTLTPDPITGVPTPSAGLLVGYTTDGNKFTSGFDLVTIEADESKAPLFTDPGVETITIEGNLMQIVDPAVVDKMLPNAKFDAALGLWSFGGAITFPLNKQPTVTLVALQRAPNNSKWCYAMLYKAMNVEAFVFNVTRKASATTPYKFQALPIGSRPPGDQLAQFAEQPATILGAEMAPGGLGQQGPQGPGQVAPGYPGFSPQAR